MITVTKKFEFEAAHHLPNHPGKCINLHGHTYKLEVEVSGLPHPVTGMIIDFGDLKKEVNNKIIDKLDHKYLNDVFPEIPTTAENMVSWIAHQLDFENCYLVRVRLYETSNSYAEWRNA